MQAWSTAFPIRASDEKCLSFPLRKSCFFLFHYGFLSLLLPPYIPALFLLFLTACRFSLYFGILALLYFLRNWVSDFFFLFSFLVLDNIPRRNRENSDLKLQSSNSYLFHYSWIFSICQVLLGWLLQYRFQVTCSLETSDLGRLLAMGSNLSKIKLSLNNDKVYLVHWFLLVLKISTFSLIIYIRKSFMTPHILE